MKDKEKQAEYRRLVLRFASIVRLFQESDDKNQRSALIRESRELTAQARALVGTPHESEEPEKPKKLADHRGLFVVESE